MTADPTPLPFDSATTPDGPEWLSLILDQAYLYDGPAPCSFAYTGNCTEGQLVVTRCHREQPGNESVIDTRCPTHQARWVRDHYGVTP